MPPRPLPIVAVIGSGLEPHEPHAARLGAALASRGVHLVTGGGRGVMEAVSRGFAEAPGRRGSVVGILPARAEGDPEPPEGYPNPWLEIRIRTHLHERGSRGGGASSRNHAIILTAQAVIALPGGAGTATEVELAARYGRPVAHFHPEGASDRSASPPVLATLGEVGAFLDGALAGG